MNDLTIDNQTIIHKLEHTLLEFVMAIMKGEKTNTPIIRLSKKKRSPIVIPFPEIENSFIIYYPANSAHYVEWDGEKKTCRILDGQLYDAIEGRSYTKEDGVFEVSPNKRYDPFTKGDDCIAFVRKYN